MITADINRAQLVLLAQCLLFGVGAGLVYDVFRALRRGGAGEGVCDALFCAVTLAAAFRFGLVSAAGQWRLFALAGAAATFGNVYVGKVAGAAIFPAGLTMVVLAGSELFTGNCLLIIPLLEREIRLRALLRSWALVYLGNFLGSVLVAGLCSAAGTLDVVRDAVIATAEMKASLPFGAALLRGVLCNFLVCIAVWMSQVGESAAEKFIGLYGPIFVFVLCGFEHSIANMFYLPAGIFLGANVGWGGFLLSNLLPVTLGNIVGGCLVGIVYRAVYLKKKG